jgi:hypothetical protein
MNALETLREKLKQGNSGISPSPEGLNLSREQASLFFDRTVIPAYLKIADELKAFPVRAFARKRHYSARLLVNDNVSSFNFRILVDNESGTLKIFYKYSDNNITNYYRPGETVYCIDGTVTRRCKTINLNEYETLTEDRIIEAFTDSYLPRKEVAAKIVEEKKTERAVEIARETEREKICKDCEDRIEESYFPSLKPLFCLFCLFAVLISATAAFAQSAKWRYVMTATGGKKTYLNDEIKNLPDRHKGAWEKMIDPDGSSVVVLAEYDCASKRRTPVQLFFYNSDGALTNIKKVSLNWMEFSPDSIAVAFHARLCLLAQPVKWAQIINARTPLRRMFGNDSPIIRIAYQGELFQIAPESGLGGWFNVVDSETQMDYWLPGDWFETIEVAQAPKKRSVAAAPTVVKKKTQKATVRKRKAK